jgi:tripeptidyl-peptidase I
MSIFLIYGPKTVSNPFHERYGQHLTFDEVNDLVKPHDDTLELVHCWLQEHGVELDNLDYTPAKDWITVALPVSTVEALLDTKYSVYKHEDGGYIVRTPVWSLPLHLHEHIETIQPTNSFFRPEPQKKAMKPVGEGELPDFFEFQPTPQYKPGQSVAEVCNVTKITPLCLRTLYGTVDYTPQVPGKNVVGLTDYLKESNNRSDTEIFLKQYRPEAAPAAYTFQVQVIAGGDDQQTPNTPDQLAAGKDLEGNLDVETILAIDYPTPLIAFTTGGSPPFIPDEGTPTNTNEPYIVWLQYVLAQKSLPQAISTSYADDEQTVPYAYANSVCRGFAQLGARGVSLFFASGDSGAGPTGECISNDGKNKTQFIPSFPPSCPYVTVVGATKNFNPEVVAYDPENGFSSGGGFSNYFKRPEWQDSAVSEYLKGLNSSNAYPSLYNKSGRGYPDIAAQGQSYAVVWFGRNILLDGTSASTPCATSVISLVNDVLIADGKPPLGWLNPWLYAIGHRGFNDITIGSTLGCGTDGFPAKPGWDAATGFGTPVR